MNPPKPYKAFIPVLLIALGQLMSCGTIVGGSKYYAHILVENHPKAKIIYNEEEVGQGNATLKVKRKEANRFSFSVQEDGCPVQYYHYTSRRLRGWTIAGSLVFFTGAYVVVPLPYGLAIDMGTGASWKPDIFEDGVSKNDYKNYQYWVRYEDCGQTQPGVPTIDVVYLKNGGLIKGKIIARGSTIKIQTKEGNVFVYKKEKIAKIIQEPINTVR